VLVGGFGTRLRPLTLARPKQLLPVVHSTMLERVVSRLGQAGVTEVVLSLGYQPDLFRAAFPDSRCAGVDLLYAQEPEPLDTAGAIAFAARFAGIDDTFLALNGDVLTDLDIETLWQRHRDSGADGTLHLTPVDDPSRFGVVDVGPDGVVRSFVEKPAPGTAPTNLINAGTYVLEPSVLDLVEPGRPCSIERDIFPPLAQAGRLSAFSTDDYWIDAGTPEAYLTAQIDLLDGRRRGEPEDGIHPGAKVGATATITRSVVADTAWVDDGAIVVDSVVMAGARIGADAVIRQSIVGWEANVAPGAVLDELTVIGSGQEVESGAHLHGDLRPPRDQWT
jgi:mannose-1-phosphate guanylyltransferase